MFLVILKFDYIFQKHTMLISTLMKMSMLRIKVNIRTAFMMSQPVCLEGIL